MSQRAVTRSGYHFIVRFISESPMFREIGLIWRIPRSSSRSTRPPHCSLGNPRPSTIRNTTSRLAPGGRRQRDIPRDSPNCTSGGCSPHPSGHPIRDAGGEQQAGRGRPDVPRILPQISGTDHFLGQSNRRTRHRAHPAGGSICRRGRRSTRNPKSRNNSSSGLFGKPSTRRRPLRTSHATNPTCSVENTDAGGQ